jgi:hypothetical protein
LNTSGVSLNFSDAHVATASKTIGATGNVVLGTLTSVGSGLKDGSGAGNLVISQAGDYALPAQPAITSVAGVINAATLTATASITAAAKTYDGLLAATGSTVSGNVTGLVGTDAMALNTSGVSLSFSDAHVATVGKTISATGSVSLGTLTSVGSGLKDGSSAGNFVVALASDYVMPAQPTIASVAGTINAAPLTAALTNTGVTKPFDGTPATPAGFTPTFSVSGLVAGDTAATLTNTGSAYNSAHVDVPAVPGASFVSASGLVLTGITGTAGSAASDYALVSTTASSAIGSASITPVAMTVVALAGTVTKTYDGTTVATLAPGNYVLSGVAGVGSVNVTQTVGTYANANIGTGIDVTTTVTNSQYSAAGGAQLSDYTILPTTVSLTGIGIGAITAPTSTLPLTTGAGASAAGASGATGTQQIQLLDQVTSFPSPPPPAPAPTEEVKDGNKTVTRKTNVCR